MGDIAFAIVFTLFFIFVFMMIIKNYVTYRNHHIISKAIYAYMLDAMKYEEFEWSVDWSDMEDYDITLWRLWDWGYKSILPKEKFEIIERYIQPNKEKNND